MLEYFLMEIKPSNTVGGSMNSRNYIILATMTSTLLIKKLFDI